MNEEKYVVAVIGRWFDGHYAMRYVTWYYTNGIEGLYCEVDYNKSAMEMTKEQALQACAYWNDCDIMAVPILCVENQIYWNSQAPEPEFDASLLT